MTRRDPNFSFAPSIPARLYDAPRQQGWGRLWLRLAIIALFGVLVGAVLMGKAHAAEGYGLGVRTAVVNDPASAKSQDVKPLIRNDLQVYLDGGRSALGWGMHVTTAAKLVQAYRTNEVAANREFMDGPDIVVTGRVESVAVTFETPTIRLAGGLPFQSLSAFMVKGHTDWIAGVRQGDKVTVACRRVRQVLTMVGAYECEPRATYVSRMVDSYFYSMHGLAKQGDRMAAKLVEIASK